MFPMRLALRLLLFVFLGISGSAFANDSSATCIPERLTAPLCFQEPGGTVNAPVEYYGAELYRSFFVLNQSDINIVQLDFQKPTLRGVISSKSAPISMRINGKVTTSIAIAPGTNALFELQATFPDTGSWFADLRCKVTSPGKKKEKESKSRESAFQLEFHCNPPRNNEPGKPFFAVEEISTVNANCNNPKIRIVLRNTSDKDGTLNIPQIILRKKVGDDGRAQANYGKITFEDQGKKEVTDWIIKKGEQKTVMASIEGLGQPGSYEGQATFSAVGQTEIKQTFTLNRKSHVLWAILMVGIGTLGGYVVTRLIGNVKPRLLLTRHGILLKQKLELAQQQFEPMNGEESRMHSFLKTEVEEIIVRLKYEENKEMEPHLLLLRAKTEVFFEWIGTSRQVKFLEVEKQTEAMTTALKQVESWMWSEGSKPDERSAQFNSLSEVMKLVEAEKSAKALLHDDSPDSSARKAEPFPTLKEVSRRLRNAEIYSTAIIMALAIALGLATFYFPNDSWGSASDQILLVLWGFGLHTFTKNTDFNGGIFGFLTGKLSPASASAA